MNDNFFPTEDYKMPTTSNYMKFEEGENAFRVLSSAIIGYEYFTMENKPVRSKEQFDAIPVDIKMVKDDAGKSVPSKISHFWAFAVWNYQAKRVQVLELTQKTIMKPMQAYIKNPKWGSPKEYDFIVNKTGSGFDTEYALTVNPKSPLDEEVKVACKKLQINLEALYEGGDPFKAMPSEDKLSDGSDFPKF